MKLRREQVEIGYILQRDIMGTTKPLITKGTVFKEIHLEVLRSFAVEEVTVENTKEDGSPIHPQNENPPTNKEKQREQEQLVQKELLVPATFEEKYEAAVMAIRKEFKSWQSGAPIQVSAVRMLLYPILEDKEITAQHVLQIPTYSTEEDYLFHHGVACAFICAYIAKQLHYAKGEIMQVGMAAILSDCGMAKLDQHLLMKKGTYNETERQEMQQHPTYSYRMVQSLTTVSDSVKVAILQHHERINGSGYPFGENGARIHRFAKIIGVADIYHAMTSQRKHQKRQSPYAVLEEIRHKQFGQFDLQVVDVLLKTISSFSVGSKVELTDGRRGEIVFIDEQNPTKPMVRLEQSEEIIPLSKVRGVHIQEVISF
ncbi:HD-GYP domain-containing protein [Bacillus fonticola]|uniref:HD-GYP domain-containing protein n=1 Tax=Bacillus fonticola TaxID=2728853 RepID=UPI0014728451|nr:HD-GYP domain-containing protein [Bacillus fonticola]